MNGLATADSDGRSVLLQPQGDNESLKLEEGDRISFEPWWKGDESKAVNWRVEPEGNKMGSDMVLPNVQLYRIMIKPHGEWKFKELRQGTPEKLRQELPLAERGKGLKQRGKVEFEVRIGGKWTHFDKDPRLIR
jgi:hypothetical protein